MTPFRRRKKRPSRAQSRRQELVEKERRQYGRDRTSAPGEPAGPDAEASGRARGRARPPRRARLGGFRDASRSGVRATARRTGPGTRRLLGSAGRGVGRVFALVLRFADLVERGLVRVFDAIVDAFDFALDLGERWLTPERALVAVIIGAAACLGVSQFVAYRGVEVGQPQYVDVSSVAPAPQTDRIDAGAAHAYVLLPLALIAVVIAVAALVTQRWRLARLVSVIGVLGIAVSLAIDLPKGLDAGTAGSAFQGANATLTEGFYAQLAASAAMVLCGWMLSINLRQGAGAGRRRQVRSRRPPPRRAASVAGGGA